MMWSLLGFRHAVSKQRRDEAGENEGVSLLRGSQVQDFGLKAYFGGASWAHRTTIALGRGLWAVAAVVTSYSANTYSEGVSNRKIV